MECKLHYMYCRVCLLTELCFYIHCIMSVFYEQINDDDDDYVTPLHIQKRKIKKNAIGYRDHDPCNP